MGQPFISDLSPCAFWEKVRGDRQPDFNFDPEEANRRIMGRIETTRDKILDLLEYVINEWKSEYPGSMSREDIEKKFYNRYF